MNRIVVLTIGLILTHGACSLFAQPDPYEISPSPKYFATFSHGFGTRKIGLIPSTMLAGTINVNIPLCKLKSSHLEVPISLSFQSNGTKVDQIASWVGLNWSLNSRGVISRMGRDDRDEENIFKSKEAFNKVLEI